jgi:hypothetical protein
MTKRGSLNKKLDAAAWGLFFIWTGIAFLADVGWGAGLLGVGIITLGAQVARRYFALKLEGFWVVVGFLFMVGGIWELFRVQIGLVPILCIIAGFALLVSIFVGRARNSGLPDRC